MTSSTKMTKTRGKSVVWRAPSCKAATLGTVPSAAHAAAKKTGIVVRGNMTSANRSVRTVFRKASSLAFPGREAAWKCRDPRGCGDL
jgi:hypothetical protein